MLCFSHATELHALLSSEHSERFESWQHQADFRVTHQTIFAEHLFCARLIP